MSMSTHASASNNITHPTPELASLRRPSATFGSRFWRSHRAVYGLFFLILVSAVAILAPVLAPYPAMDQDPSRAQLPPLSTSKEGDFFILGTDALGRDLLSRMMFGGRISL